MLLNRTHMKKIFTLIILSVIFLGAQAQDFDKNLSTAQTAYASGNLEEARFAMQQMLTDIDMMIGQEVLKVLPTKMGAHNANVANDNVTANAGFAGVMIHREYGSGEKLYNLDLIGNSPMVATINAFLSLPFVANSGDGTQKVVRISGYKAMLQKSVDEERKVTDYTLQVPLGSTLLTFTAPNTTEDEVIKLANTIPVAEITKLVQ